MMMNGLSQIQATELDANVEPNGALIQMMHAMQETS